MRIVVGITGASGAIYAQRLMDRLDPVSHEVHLVLSQYANQVIAEEIGELKVPKGFIQHADKSMNVPFVSGSAVFDAMVIIPCSMGTLGRMANGTSETTLLRAADVFLKERRKLILVPRETPLSLIHVRNMAILLEAGAVLIPAMPGFYSRPQSVEEVVDTVVARVLDHLGVPHEISPRWKDAKE
ncbi:MAG: UbiX family flavin prenyltransferase [Verrucomicrobiota bacterium]|nr:UbiX family flavin prenyltransferase [Verrucomicrobiota bacterium]